MSESYKRLHTRRNFVSRMAAVSVGRVFASQLLRPMPPSPFIDAPKIAVPGFSPTETLESLPGQKSMTFSGTVGTTYIPAKFPQENYLIDASRFASEGNWAFCRFTSEEIPAVRMGFQRGGFNITPSDKLPEKSRLQLHLEIMTKDGALLWLPSGRYPAERVTTSSKEMKIELRAANTEIFSIQGWPDMNWHFRSDDGEAEADLHFKLNNVTLLPDCILPQCVFSMWEAIGDVHGTIRHKSRSISVAGKVFYDHPRIVQRPSHATPRTMYLYTTMFFGDGSCWFGYHARDDKRTPINYYCFGVYVDASRKVYFLQNVDLLGLEIGSDKIPQRWKLRWDKKELAIEIHVSVRHPQLLKSWGSPQPAHTDFPLVLDSTAKVSGNGRTKSVSGQGLAEYYDAAL
jgi:hypothetical protein